MSGSKIDIHTHILPRLGATARANLSRDAARRILKLA